MFRLFISRTARTGKPSSFRSRRRLHQQTNKASAFISALSPHRFPPRLHRSCSKFVSWYLSPFPLRLLSSKGLNGGLDDHTAISAKTEGFFASDHALNAVKRSPAQTEGPEGSLASDHAVHAVKRSPAQTEGGLASSDHAVHAVKRSPAQAEGSLASSDRAVHAVKRSPFFGRRPLGDGRRRGFNGWLYGAAAAMSLSLAAFAFPKDDGISAALRDFDFDTAVSELQILSEDTCARLAGACEQLSSSLSSFWDKASEAVTAMAVLARCVNAVLFTKGEDYANELALRWKLRVISLLADLTASSRSRRTALIQAGSGSVLDWLLKAVSQVNEEHRLVQAEAARALSHFLSDDFTCEVVLGRPNALSHLLLFAASIRPNTSAKDTKAQKFGLFLGNDEKTRGRSMLVGALMDIITSSCESEEKGVVRPKLSGLANMTDISAALKVLQEGSLCLGEANGESTGTNGNHGLDAEAIQANGLSSSNESSVLEVHKQLANFPGSGLRLVSGLRNKALTNAQLKLMPDSIATGSAGSMAMNHEPFSDGLWDDLHGNHVAVPLAAWAIATWAQASSSNCGKIARIDEDGAAILACIMAPERTVKWHGAIAARMVLEEGFNEQAASPWSGALLESAKHASTVDDRQLCLMALDSFHSCIRMSREAHELAAKNSLQLLRSIAKQAAANEPLQKLTAQILESLIFHGTGLSSEEGKKWSSILLGWLFNCNLDDSTHFTASKILARVLDELGPNGVPLSQVWLAMIIQGTVNGSVTDPARGDAQGAKMNKSKPLIQGRLSRAALQAANELAKAVLLSIGEAQATDKENTTADFDELEWGDLNKIHLFNVAGKVSKKDKGKLTSADPVEITMKAVKTLIELAADDKGCQQRVIEMGCLQLLRRFMLKDDYESLSSLSSTARLSGNDEEIGHQQAKEGNTLAIKEPYIAPAHLKKHAARMLSMLSLQPSATAFIERDEAWCTWLEECANNEVSSSNNLKTCSYARATLLNLQAWSNCGRKCVELEELSPRYEDKVYIMNTQSPLWRHLNEQKVDVNEGRSAAGNSSILQEENTCSDFKMDVIFVHGLRGGPFKTWRIADDKTSATSKAGLVEKIDVDSGKEGTCWPKEWLAHDIPTCRVLTVKYKTNLSQWSGTTLPLQEVSAMLLQKLLAAGVGDRPVVFITHSMGGLVVKQMLMQAGQDKLLSQIVKNTAGIVFYSCPHFGSKLADMPWRLGLVLRPAPSIGELRSGSARLEELNQFIRIRHKAGLHILSFSETKVTPLVEGYGGWALRVEVVPIESAYPGYGELVVLDGTDHVNSCKPLSRDDIAYTQTLELLQKISRSLKTSGP